MINYIKCSYFLPNLTLAGFEDVNSAKSASSCILKIEIRWYIPELNRHMLSMLLSEAQLPALSLLIHSASISAPIFSMFSASVSMMKYSEATSGQSSAPVVSYLLAVQR